MLYPTYNDVAGTWNAYLAKWMRHVGGPRPGLLPCTPKSSVQSRPCKTKTKTRQNETKELTQYGKCVFDYPAYRSACRAQTARGVFRKLKEQAPPLPHTPPYSPLTALVPPPKARANSTLPRPARGGALRPAHPGLLRALQRLFPSPALHSLHLRSKRVPPARPSQRPLQSPWAARALRALSALSGAGRPRFKK